MGKDKGVAPGYGDKEAFGQNVSRIFVRKMQLPNAARINRQAGRQVPDKPRGLSSQQSTSHVKCP